MKTKQRGWTGSQQQEVYFTTKAKRILLNRISMSGYITKGPLKNMDERLTSTIIYSWNGVHWWGKSKHKSINNHNSNNRIHFFFKSTESCFQQIQFIFEPTYKRYHKDWQEFFL